MRKFLMVAAAMLLMAPAANAKTIWTAICNDGQNMKYEVTDSGSGGVGALSMKVRQGYFRIATTHGRPLSDRDIYCAMLQDAQGNSICVNRSYGSIFIMMSSDPDDMEVPLSSTRAVCMATVTVDKQ